MPAAAKALPLRTCVGCRARAVKSELARLVVVDGRAVVDLAGRLPGRGAYVHLTEECVTAAVSRKALNRAFRGQVDTSSLSDWPNQSPLGA